MISANEIKEISSVICYSIIEDEVDEKPVIFHWLVFPRRVGDTEVVYFQGPWLYNLMSSVIDCSNRESWLIPIDAKGQAHFSWQGKCVVGLPESCRHFLRIFC